MVTESEKKFISLINKDFMTDESDSESSSVIVVHKHSWRSQSK